MSGFRIRLETLVLGLLIPSLLVISCITGYLIYQTIDDVIQQGFDKKLFAISTTCAAFIDGPTHQAILAKSPSEDSVMYLQYVAPMRRILNKANAKYVYSQIVGPTSDPTKDITYILDGTVGPDHSHIGDLDALPPAERNGCHAIQDGRRASYNADMRYWPEWGELKSCYAAIYDHAGHVLAMTGTDIDVNIVLTKMNQMITVVGFVSLLCILAGVFLALQLARRVTRPIALVKEGALMVAAGQYGHRIEINQPTELADLARSFNKLSTALAATVEELSSANRELEQRRRSQELRRVLGDSVDDTAQGVAGDHLAACRLGNRNLVSSSSGYVISADADRLVTWLVKPTGDQMQDARQRAEIAETAQRLLTKNADGPSTALPRELAALFPAIDVAVVFEGDAHTVRSFARQSAPALILTAGDSETIDLATRDVFTLRPSQIVIVGQGEPAAYARFVPKVHATAEEIAKAMARAAESLETEQVVSILVA